MGPEKSEEIEFKLRLLEAGSLYSTPSKADPEAHSGEAPRVAVGIITVCNYYFDIRGDLGTEIALKIYRLPFVRGRIEANALSWGGFRPSFVSGCRP